MTNRTDRFVEVNRTATKLTNYKATALLDLSIPDIIATEDRCGLASFCDGGRGGVR
ncbi:MAG: hypothetical protein IPL11_10975 [Candidatus Accumulibacter sp.]|nr:hypothetical protein [Accumulibacter sp.]